MNKLGTVLAACCVGVFVTACGASTLPTVEGSAETPIDTGSAPIENTTVIESPAEDPGSAPVDTSGSGSASVVDDPNTQVFGDYVVTILDYSIRPDCDGEPALRVVFEFTNNAKRSASFSTSVALHAFQDASPMMIPEEKEDSSRGLDLAKPSVLDNEYTRMLSLIDPGETITCAGYFKLLDTETPVTIKVTNLRNSTAESLTRVLEISDLEMEVEEENNADE